MSWFILYFCVAGLFYITRCYYCLEVMQDQDTIDAFGPLIHKKYIIYLVCMLFGFVALPLEIIWGIYELLTGKNG